MTSNVGCIWSNVSPAREALGSRLRHGRTPPAVGRFAHSAATRARQLPGASGYARKTAPPDLTLRRPRRLGFVARQPTIICAPCCPDRHCRNNAAADQSPCGAVFSITITGCPHRAGNLTCPRRCSDIHRLPWRCWFVGRPGHPSHERAASGVALRRDAERAVSARAGKRARRFTAATSPRVIRVDLNGTTGASVRLTCVAHTHP
jgi:hypothetical protein